MDIRVEKKYIKTAPRKVRLIVDLIRGKKALDVLYQLKYITKQGARDTLEILKSGLAAAKERNLEEKNLYIKEIFCNEGPRLKRRRYRPRGRATVIRKRMSHITLVLSDQKQKNKEHRNNKGAQSES